MNNDSMSQVFSMFLVLFFMGTGMLLDAIFGWPILHFVFALSAKLGGL